MSEWISVEDRMPECETDVLVMGIRGNNSVKHTVAGIFEGGWASCETEENTKFCVTHWQPLPPPPGTPE